MLQEATPTERAATLTYALACGRALTTQEVAALCDLTDSGARRLVYRVSRVLPVARADGRWFMISDNAPHNNISLY